MDNWTIEDVQQTIREFEILFDNYDGEIDQHLLASVKSAQWQPEDLIFHKLNDQLATVTDRPNLN